MKIEILPSKLYLMKVFVMVFLIGITTTLQAQNLYDYYRHSENGIGKLKEINGGNIEVSADPVGQVCADIIRFTINDSPNSSLVYSLGGGMDFSENQQISIKVYLSEPETVLTNNTLACGIRSSSDSNSEVVVTQQIDTYNQWVEYTFDFSEAPNDVVFNEIYFYFIYNDDSAEGDKLQFYVDEVKGPKVIPTQVVTVANTDNSGNVVVVDFPNHAGIKSIINPSFVVREKESGNAIDIKSVIIKESQVQLLLSRQLQLNEEVTLDYVSGEVTDNNSNELTPFEGLEVKNNFNQIDNLYPYYNFGEPSLITTIQGINCTLDDNYTNTDRVAYDEGVVGKIIRGQVSWADMALTLPENTTIDFSQSKIFSIDVMIEDIGIENADKRISFGLEDANGDAIQASRKLSDIEVKCYGNWKRYYFDFSAYTEEELEGYDKIKFFLAPDDKDGKGTGLIYYVDNLMGPKLTHSDITSNASIIDGGKAISLEFLTHASISTVEDAVFTVKVNDSEVTIDQTEQKDNGFVFHLSSILTGDDNVTISYTEGNIIDVDGIALTTFTDKVVENNLAEAIGNDGVLQTLYKFDGSDNPSSSFNGTMTEEIVDDPLASTGLSPITNAKVTKLTRVADKSHPSINIPFSGRIFFNEGRKFKLYAYHPENQNVGGYHRFELTIRDSEKGTWQKAEDGSLVIKEGATWYEYTFDFTGMTYRDGSDIDACDQLELGVVNSAKTEGVVYYISDFRGPELKSDDDISLSSILVDAMLIEGFDQNTTEYTVDIPFGITDVPVITANASNPNASAVVTPANNLTESTTIQVTAVDGSTEDYTVSFNLLPASSNADLASITIDGVPFYDFDANISSYEIKYVYGTEAIPTIEAKTGDKDATFSVDLPDALPGTATIMVTAQDGTEKEYSVALNWAKGSDNAYLSAININNRGLVGFDKTLTQYTQNYNYGTTTVPTVTVELENALATYEIDVAEQVPGATTITVTPQDGEAKVYTINWAWLPPSDDATLAKINLDGTLIEGFYATKTSYSVEYPFGTTDVPTLTVVRAHSGSSYVINPATTMPGQTEVIVTAQDGETELTYTVDFTIADQRSPDASISSITVGGILLDNYQAGVADYTVDLPHTATTVPTVEVEATSSVATVDVQDAENLDGTTVVTVTSQNEQVQTVVNISFNILPPSSSDATLASISINDEAIANFNAQTTTYEYTLAISTTELPVVSAETADENATVNIIQVDVLDGTAIIEVTAEDEVTTKTYEVAFSVREASVNASLSAVYLDGQALEGFDATTTGYIIEVTALPVVTVETEDENAQIMIVDAQGIGGLAIITVTAEDGITQKVYTILMRGPVLSLNEQFNSQLKVFSSTSQTLKVLSEFDLAGSSLRVIDLKGTVVVSKLIYGTKVEITGLKKGIYVVQIVNPQGGYSTKVKI